MTKEAISKHCEGATISGFFEFIMNEALYIACSYFLWTVSTLLNVHLSARVHNLIMFLTHFTREKC